MSESFIMPINFYSKKFWSINKDGVTIDGFYFTTPGAKEGFRDAIALNPNSVIQLVEHKVIDTYKKVED